MEAGVFEAGVVDQDDNDGDGVATNIDDEEDDDDDTKVVSWTDVPKDNVITTGCWQRQLKKHNTAEGYHLTNIGEDMYNFLMVQTTYVASMRTVAKIDTVIPCAINHVILTQLGMKKGIKKIGEAGVHSFYKEMK